MRRVAFGFRRGATREDLVATAEALVSQEDADRAWAYSWALLFSRLRQFDPTEILLKKPVESAETGRILANALKLIRNPRLRELGLVLLNWRPPILDGLQLLEVQVEPGDELLARKCLRIASRRNKQLLHHIVMDVLGLSKAAPSQPWKDCLAFSYDHSPCSYCRKGAFDRLKERGEATEEMILDHEWDSEAFAWSSET
jgi:hypothetical protein